MNKIKLNKNLIRTEHLTNWSTSVRIHQQFPSRFVNSFVIELAQKNFHRIGSDVFIGFYCWSSWLIVFLLIAGEVRFIVFIWKQMHFLDGSLSFHPSPHTEKSFEILLNQPEIRLYLPFSLINLDLNGLPFGSKSIWKW